ncbi:MAG: hypothetical protein WAN65_32710 [Candidatus Sulfotelmatobacter sp.]
MITAGSKLVRSQFRRGAHALISGNTGNKVVAQFGLLHHGVYLSVCHPERSRFPGEAKDLPLRRPRAQAKTRATGNKILFKHETSTVSMGIRLIILKLPFS